MTLWYFPIEPYDERYTQGLDAWVQSELRRQGIPYQAIYGDLIPATHALGGGEVLDVEGRPYYCFSQLQKFLLLIKQGAVQNGDILFTTDFWFPGIEAIQYACDMRKLRLKKYGFVCSGSFEEHDFTNKNGMTRWARDLERSWSVIFDVLFVANDRMKEMVAPLEKVSQNVMVTGLPANTQWILSQVPPAATWTKDKVVVFPHRWDTEKCPDFFMDVVEIVGERRPEIHFWITSGRKDVLGDHLTAWARANEMKENVRIFMGLPKPKYYDLLTKSTVVFSAALQDTVGNAMIESLTLGNTPVVPKGQYEYIPERFCYTRGDAEEAARLVITCIDHPKPQPEIVRQFDESIRKMIKVMREAPPW